MTPLEHWDKAGELLVKAARDQVLRDTPATIAVTIAMAKVHAHLARTGFSYSWRFDEAQDL